MGCCWTGVDTGASCLAIVTAAYLGFADRPFSTSACKPANSATPSLTRRSSPLLLQYYDFPVVSMRSAVWRNMAAGVEGFRVSPALGNGSVGRGSFD